MSQPKNAIDFSSLKSYARAFRFFKVVTRIKMILVRVAIIGIILAIAAYLAYIFWIINIHPEVFDSSAETTTTSYEYDLSHTGTINLGPPLVILAVLYFGPPFWTLNYMRQVMDKFARGNNFWIASVVDPETVRIKNVPSFRGKLLASSLAPVMGEHDGMQFALFTRQYKEGGVLRWRERHMDTILALSLPKDLPHIVINALANERARQSNLSVSYPSTHRFRFEGVYGTKFDVYTDPMSRVEALQLFTPDVLEVMYNKLPMADIEVKGNILWIVQRYGVLDSTSASQLFDGVQALYKKLIR